MDAGLAFVREGLQMARESAKDNAAALLDVKADVASLARDVATLAQGLKARESHLIKYAAWMAFLGGVSGTVVVGAWVSLLVYLLRDLVMRGLRP